MEQARILVADDEVPVVETYSEIFEMSGHAVDTATRGDEALELIRHRTYDLLLTDLVFPPTDGLEVLREAKRIRPSMLVVVFSGHATVESVMAAFRGGAYDFVEKPVDAEQLQALAQRALEIRKLGESRRRLAEELESERYQVMELKRQLAAQDPFHRLIGSSVKMKRFIDTLREVARTDSTVLLTGESGTGKSLIARTIHEASARSAAPFVEANCVVYSEGVLQSELFGHERGAFTGAARTKRGRFELARGGTLFLDEIGEIPAATQLMLLRVLHDRTFERVGGEETFEADVRLIAATNRDLMAAIREGTFRSDLYYRLNVIPVHLPPLREHVDDVAILAHHFLARFAEELKRPVEAFSADAVSALMAYPWPGNIRELENMVERLVVLNRGGRIELDDLPPEVRGASVGARRAVSGGTLQDVERVRIQDVLQECQGNKKLAAERLGIHRSTLYAKLRRYGLGDDDVDLGSEVSERHDASEFATPALTR